jgi:YHS domain-containing protein/uncharacterized membrane protein YraQ (UPF0718 family)
VSFLASVPLLTHLFDALREAFFMFWETLWALVLGFALSGVVQAFITKTSMQRKLGDHRARSVLRASGYGMASSSCSYAASAMSKSLFARGADFVTAMIFMIASTNLVIELGLVLLVLMGWQFMAAEFVGGPVMIVVIAILGGLVFAPRLVTKARIRLDKLSRLSSDYLQFDDHGNVSWRVKVRSAPAWSDAANYAVADAKMLRRELAIGYLVAGCLAALVPTQLWHGLFWHGHGAWTVLENAAVGPLIAVASWVCSVGNVPLAAALWSGGISFGGVVAFLFADLISMPLILIYRKFYGTALTVRVVALFYFAMVCAGLVSQLLFSGFSLVPARRAITVHGAHLSWNYTTYLNLVFMAVAVGVWALARQRSRGAESEIYAIDPVCAMQVRRADAPASVHYESATYYFCADRCQDRFVANPTRYLSAVSTFELGERNSVAVALSPRASGDLQMHVDPFCLMQVSSRDAVAKRELNGATYWFCSQACAESFDERRSHEPAG